MPPRRRPHEARPNRHAGEGGRGQVRNEGDLAGHLAERANPLVLILDGVQDPHNLGAILRSADGAGVDAVVAPKDRAAGITETVRRISVGAADHVPFFQVTNLARTMDEMKEAGIWLVGTSDHATQSIYETDLAGPLAIVMGAEETGLRRLTEEKCDFLVEIPMGGTVECLNVSVATGV
ncbi:MAG: 23S rRNA (guanosine(2251)-2'-O)-methyltransferase RlmB, partial [Akkermansiaceae bacterium]|nr:23S rRNA (guanosine(2251)-2'-O)-methyltransferase RlmB [Akkermansiaceae bacterium]